MRPFNLICRGGDGFGTGHLYRTSWIRSSLLEFASERPEVTVWCNSNAITRDFWQEQGVQVNWIESACLDLVQPQPGSVVIVDWLDSQPQEVCDVAQRHARVVLLDDYGPAADHALLVINSLLSQLQDGEVKTPKGRIVSGVKWLQLPPGATKLRSVAASTLAAARTELREGLSTANWPVFSILVNFGGSIALDAVALTLESLSVAGYKGKVVLIPAPDVVARHDLDIDLHAAGNEFHALLAASDLAICAGGLALYEAAYQGVPAICVPLVEHQLKTAEKLSAAGACLCAGPLETLTSVRLAGLVGGLLADVPRRIDMSCSGTKILDGNGLQRSTTLIWEMAA